MISKAIRKAGKYVTINTTVTTNNMAAVFKLAIWFRSFLVDFLLALSFSLETLLLFLQGAATGAGAGADLLAPLVLVVTVVPVSPLTVVSRVSS